MSRSDGSARTQAEAVYADFQNADVEGCIRLNTAGTTRDLAKYGIALKPGLALTLFDGELSTQGTVLAPGKEGVWRASIAWETLSE